jgi:hypothetical protein
MNILTISKDTVHIEIKGWDKIWAFKGALDIHRNSIAKIYKYDGTIKPPWCKWPGTAIPRVIIAGTYYGRGRKEFWNFHFQKNAIVFDLKDADYTRIVIDVDEQAEILSLLTNM